MQLKKLIPACLALVMLCGCSSNNSSTSSKKDNNKSSDTATETVDAKDLTTVKGTMDLSDELFKDSYLEGSTVEYTVDKDGLVHTINFHRVSIAIPYDDEKVAKTGQSAYLEDSKIDNWKKETNKSESFKGKGYSIQASVTDKLDEAVVEKIKVEKVGYMLVTEINFDSTKATSKSAADFAIDISESETIKSKGNKITEKSLKKLLTENYNMTYTNE